MGSWYNVEEHIDHGKPYRNTVLLSSGTGRPTVRYKQLVTRNNQQSTIVNT